MDYFLDLKNHEYIIIDYLRGFGTEEIAIKYDFEHKIVNDMIDLYNYFYN